VQNKQVVKPKPIPLRTCIACRQTAGKRALVRVIRTDQGVEVDPTGKKAGRGAYLHPNQQCWQNALSSNRLGQALRGAVMPEDRQRLLAFMATLPLQEET
jgi:hypothetical protein